MEAPVTTRPRYPANAPDDVNIGTHAGEPSRSDDHMPAGGKMPVNGQTHSNGRGQHNGHGGSAFPDGNGDLAGAAPADAHEQLQPAEGGHRGQPEAADVPWFAPSRDWPQKMSGPVSAQP